MATVPKTSPIRDVPDILKSKSAPPQRKTIQPPKGGRK